MEQAEADLKIAQANVARNWYEYMWVDEPVLEKNQGLKGKTIGEIASTEPLGNGFWIPELPWSLRASWAAYNAHGRRYYARMRRRGIY